MYLKQGYKQEHTISSISVRIEFKDGITAFKTIKNNLINITESKYNFYLTRSKNYTKER